jgi:hypothetical protein
MSVGERSRAIGRACAGGAKISQGRVTKRLVGDERSRAIG